MRDYSHTDPEFTERFEYFAFNEVVNEEGQQLDDITRHMAIVATLIGCQGIDEFRLEASRALDAGLTPVMLKEIIYQAVDYLGIGRVRPSLTRPMISSLPGVLRFRWKDRQPPRWRTGWKKGRTGTGGYLRRSYERGLEGRHINRWLAANCFGDYYTRTGLDLKQREMITFCFLAAQGGCEPQLTRPRQRQYESGQ